MTSNNNGQNNADPNANLRLDCSSAAGAPTLTTPTLTPTTLRNIEQMFLEASDGGNDLEQPVIHENAAHFVPPPIAMELPPPQLPGPHIGNRPPLPGPHTGSSSLPGPNSVKVPPPLPGPHLLVPNLLVSETPSNPNLNLNLIQNLPPTTQVPLIIKHEPEEVMQPQTSTTTTTTMQLQDPLATKSSRNNNNHVISEENDFIESNQNSSNHDDRKKELRRLRNKEAAARCRKRRVDQTMTLQMEVDKLESVKNELNIELEALKSEKDKLQGILDLHQCSIEKVSSRKQPKLNIS